MCVQLNAVAMNLPALPVIDGTNERVDFKKQEDKKLWWELIGSQRYHSSANDVNIQFTFFPHIWASTRAHMYTQMRTYTQIIIKMGRDSE